MAVLFAYLLVGGIGLILAAALVKGTMWLWPPRASEKTRGIVRLRASQVSTVGVIMVIIGIGGCAALASTVHAR